MARIILSNGEAFELDAKGPTTLGSAKDCGICFGGKGVADLHCALKPLKEGGFGIKDLGSKEGTRVNGKAIRAVRLHHGDEIEIGSTRLSFDAAEEHVEVAHTEETSEPAVTKATPDETPAGGLDLDDDSIAANSMSIDSVPEDPGTLPAGSRIGGYEIQGLLGHGGMGTVYKALQISLHREVALKVLRQELAEDENFVQSFIAEARHAAKFNHPNVVQVFDVDEHEGRPFFSMELLMQGSLEAQLKREGRLGTDDAIRAMRDAARGLAYAEQLGVVHRDIKPDNLMVTSDGVTKICDLGLDGDPGAHGKGKIAGTPHFISPEQIRKSVVDHRSDIYSLGCSFYRILTGKNPYPRRKVREILKAHLEAEVPSLSAVLPDASPDLDAIVQQMMAKDPALRFQHASELADTLDEHFHPVSVVAEPKGHKGLLIGMAFVVIALVGGIAFLLSQDKEPEKIETTRPDPEKAKREKELRETKALLALKVISTQGTRLERATRYESLTKSFPDTQAAKEAKRIADALREEHAEELEKTATARQRERALVLKIETEAGKLLTTGAYLKAWQRADELAGENSKAPLVKTALVRARQFILAGLRAKVDAGLAKLEVALTDKDRASSAAETVFLNELPLRETPADRLPQEMRDIFDAARTRSRTVLAKEDGIRKKARAAMMLGMLEQRTRLLTESLQLCRAGKLADAKDRLDASKAPAGFKRAWAAIERFAKLLGSAADNEKAVLSVRRDDGRPVTVFYMGKDWFIDSYAAGTVVLLSGQRNREEKLALPLWRTAELTGQIFGKREGFDLDKETERGRRSLLFVAGLLHSVEKAAVFMKRLQNGGGKHRSELQRTLLRALLDEDWTKGPDNTEIAAVLELCKLLRAWDRGADHAASQHADALEIKHAHSVVAILLGIAPLGRHNK